MRIISYSNISSNIEYYVDRPNKHLIYDFSHFLENEKLLTFILWFLNQNYLYLTRVSNYTCIYTIIILQFLNCQVALKMFFFLKP